MERPLTEWERSVVRTLSDVDVPGIEIAHEAIDHLVVTGVCECGCGSFNVRYERHPGQRHVQHVSNGVCGEIGFALFVGPDDRPIAIDDYLPDDRTLAQYGPPSPETITVRPAP
ncbi:MAG TPA: hypothetical protein VFZ77_16075 [Acidimicrobiales bacterium]